MYMVQRFSKAVLRTLQMNKTLSFSGKIQLVTLKPKALWLQYSVQSIADDIRMFVEIAIKGKSNESN